MDNWHWRLEFHSRCYFIPIKCSGSQKQMGPIFPVIATQLVSFPDDCRCATVSQLQWYASRCPSFLKSWCRHFQGLYDSVNYYSSPSDTSAVPTWSLPVHTVTRTRMNWLCNLCSLYFPGKGQHVLENMVPFFPQDNPSHSSRVLKHPIISSVSHPLDKA